MNGHYLVVDDDHGIIEVCRDMHMTVAFDAEEGHNILEAGTGIKTAFLDIQGIQKNGKDVRTLVKACLTLNVSFYVTSGNPIECSILGNEIPGVRFISKTDIWRKVKAGE